MKSIDILNSIGEIDDEIIKNAKENQKSKNTVKIITSTIAASFVLICTVSILINLLHNDNIITGGTESASQTSYILETTEESETGLMKKNIWIYYVDGETVKKESRYMNISAEEIFDEWKEKNHIGNDVTLSSVSILSDTKDNVSVYKDEPVITHNTTSSYTTYNITISKNIQNYYKDINPKLLLETLKKTMTEYSDTKYDEYNLNFESSELEITAESNITYTDDSDILYENTEEQEEFYFDE